MERVESLLASKQQRGSGPRRGVPLLLLLLAGVTVACDGRPDYSLRSTPPEVAFATPPPPYTASPSLALSIIAMNPTGVRAVYALAGAQRWPAVRQEDGTWRVTLQLPVIGKNTVTIWAEDTSSPAPNSGLGMDPPYQLVQEIFYDPTPPSVTYDAAFASYGDERALEVAADANGIAVVPAAYHVLPKQGVLPGGHFYKAWSRLSAGAEMDASELETTNARNIPVLRFAVPFNRNTDSPLATPTFVAHLSCASPCPEYPDANGQLLPAAATDDQRALFELPLATETIPALAQLQGPGALSISITVTDAAGNTTTASGFDFVFHVIGPPLAIVEDEQYPTNALADGSTTFAYHLSNNTYAQLWDGARFPNAAVRLMRYVVTNPTTEPVALRLSYAQAAGGSWQAYEYWTWYNVGEPWFLGQSVTQKTSCYDAKSYAIDGFSFAQPFCTTAGSSVQCWNGTAWGTGSVILFHRMGDRTYRFLCGTSEMVEATRGQTAGASSVAEISVEPLRVTPELGGQERAPERDLSGQWVLVPPASGGTPGSLVVYLERPAGVPRSPALNWNLNGVPGSDAMDHYQTWEYMEWIRWSSPTSGYDWRTGYRLGRYLVSAEDRVYGTLLGSTHSYSEDGLVGEVASRISVSLAREPLFTH